MKRKTDIEKLVVQWTFCEELPKGGSEAYTPLGSGFRATPRLALWSTKAALSAC
jgi:hypothetical protein